MKITTMAKNSRTLGKSKNPVAYPKGTQIKDALQPQSSLASTQALRKAAST